MKLCDFYSIPCFAETRYEILRRVLGMKDNQHLLPDRVKEVLFTDRSRAMEFFEQTANFGKFETDREICDRLCELNSMVPSWGYDSWTAQDKLAAYAKNPQLCDGFMQREFENRRLSFNENGDCVFCTDHSYEGEFKLSDFKEKTDLYRKAAYACLCAEMIDQLFDKFNIEELRYAIYTVHPDGSKEYLIPHYWHACPSERVRLLGGIHEKSYYLPEFA